MSRAAVDFDPINRFRLDGRVAIITGASGGLGARFARVLDAAGAAVVLAARREDELQAQARQLRNGLAVRCDLTDRKSIEALVARTIEVHGRIDILVNNAGQTDEMTPAIGESRENFQRVLDINLTAPFLLSQQVAPVMMRTGGGVILNIASVLGLVAHPEKPQAAYTASKGGVVNLTRELASQWGRHGIRVNALAPGLFRSEMTEASFADEDSMAKIRARTPLARPGDPDELDGVVLFLVSSASSYMTGQIVVVDGGYTAL
jgi:NAD(P)-dependent dehydrogenase (short-subunit alcohol dehydrogenase family)